MYYIHLNIHVLHTPQKLKNTRVVFLLVVQKWKKDACKSAGWAELFATNFLIKLTHIRNKF
jgi:hypothetical protein